MLHTGLAYELDDYHDVYGRTMSPHLTNAHDCFCQSWLFCSMWRESTKVSWWLQIDRLDVFYKQRDDMFFPTWSFVLPTTIMRFPVSLVESFIWTVITYYPVGLAPQASR